MASLSTTSTSTSAPKVGKASSGIDALEKAADKLSLGLAQTTTADNIVVSTNRKRALLKAEFERLKESIKKDGLITPIVVEEIGGGKYQIISGHNRFQALTDLGINEISISIVKVKTDSERAAFISNLLQPELGVAEIFQGMRVLQRSGERPLQNKEIAKETGFSEGYVSRILKMEQLDNDIVLAMAKFRVQIGAQLLNKFIESFPNHHSDPKGHQKQHEKALAFLNEKGSELLGSLQTPEGKSLDSIGTYWHTAFTQFLNPKPQISKQVSKKVDFGRFKISSIQQNESTLTLEFESKELADQVLEILRKH